MDSRATATLRVLPASPSATAQGTTCTNVTTLANRIHSTGAKRASWDTRTRRLDGRCTVSMRTSFSPSRRESS
eukprot:2698528-Pleurochrysis_carterae.AAC.1